MALEHVRTVSGMKGDRPPWSSVCECGWAPQRDGRPHTYGTRQEAEDAWLAHARQRRRVERGDFRSKPPLPLP